MCAGIRGLPRLIQARASLGSTTELSIRCIASTRAQDKADASRRRSTPGGAGCDRLRSCGGEYAQCSKNQQSGETSAATDAAVHTETMYASSVANKAGKQATWSPRPPCSDDRAWYIPAVMAAVKNTTFATMDT
eukprot:6214045-Pleurochrysis_carterae.AAC.3